MTGAGSASVAAFCVGFTLVITGCSSSKPPVCSDITALQKSVQDLRNVSIGQGAITTIKNDLTTIQQNFQKLKADAKGQFATEIGQLSSSVDTLTANFTAAESSPTPATLAAVVTAAKTAADDAKALQSAASNTC